ncbi:MAG: hypothetical protein PV344_01875 [Anaplasma sp.]|nr:hypothetical protein [Anaplasma sp.]
MCFNATALTSSCCRKAGVGGVTRKPGMIDGVLTSQPHDLAQEFQTTTLTCNVTSRV